MLTKQKKFKKSQSQTVFFSVFISLLVLVVIGFLIFTNWKISQRRSELNLRIESLKKEIQILEEKNAQLRAGISQSLTESYLEKEAREKFNLKKPGEEVLTILPPEEGEEEMGAKEKSLWQKILEKLGF